MSHHKRGHRACAHHNCQDAGQRQRHKRSMGLALSGGQGETASESPYRQLQDAVTSSEGKLRVHTAGPPGSL